MIETEQLRVKRVKIQMMNDAKVQERISNEPLMIIYSINQFEVSIYLKKLIFFNICVEAADPLEAAGTN